MEMEREIERKIRREKGRAKYRENSHRKKKLTHQSRLTDRCLHVFLLDSMFRFSF